MGKWSSQANLGLFDMQVYVRKLRNLVAIIVMAAAYAQVFGVPDVGWSDERPLLRLSHLERPVWSYGWSATKFVWSWAFTENKS